MYLNPPVTHDIVGQISWIEQMMNDNLLDASLLIWQSLLCRLRIPLTAANRQCILCEIENTSCTGEHNLSMNQRSGTETLYISSEYCHRPWEFTWNRIKIKRSVLGLLYQLTETGLIRSAFQ